RATVERGLAWIEERHHPGPSDAWLLVPADHPTLDERIVSAVCQARDRASIVVPTWDGKRGHPALIGWRHVEGIRRHPEPEGLTASLRRSQAETLELPVASASVVDDLDTPEDYERLLRSLS